MYTNLQSNFLKRPSSIIDLSIIVFFVCVGGFYMESFQSVVEKVFCAYLLAHQCRLDGHASSGLQDRFASFSYEVCSIGIQWLLELCLAKFSFLGHLTVVAFVGQMLLTKQAWVISIVYYHNKHGSSIVYLWRSDLCF